MKPLTPASEDFFYWDPEAICHYPVRDGIEEHWFRSRRQTRTPGTFEHKDYRRGASDGHHGA